MFNSCSHRCTCIVVARTRCTVELHRNTSRLAMNYHCDAMAPVSNVSDSMAAAAAAAAAAS
jgi:hypothetical protein